jgi:hypothetical protein
VAASSLKRWMKRPDFQTAFRKARSQALAAAIGRLHHDAFQAALVLAKQLASEDLHVAARAATAILDRALRGAELLDLEERLAVLEAAEAARQKEKP